MCLPLRFVPSFPWGIQCRRPCYPRLCEHCAFSINIRLVEWATIESCTLCSPVNSIPLTNASLSLNWNRQNQSWTFIRETEYLAYCYLPITKFIWMQYILKLTELVRQVLSVDVKPLIDPQQLKVVLKSKRQLSRGKTVERLSIYSQHHRVARASSGIWCIWIECRPMNSHCHTANIWWGPTHS